MKEMKKTEVWRKIKEGKVTVIRSDAGWNGGVEKGTESKGHALCDKKGDLMELYGTAAEVAGKCILTLEAEALATGIKHAVQYNKQKAAEVCRSLVPEEGKEHVLGSNTEKAGRNRKEEA